MREMDTLGAASWPGTPQQIWDGFTRSTRPPICGRSPTSRASAAPSAGSTPDGGNGDRVGPAAPLPHRGEQARRLVQPARLPDRRHATCATCTHVRRWSDEFDVQYDACVQHTNFYMHSLGEYLAALRRPRAALPRLRRRARHRPPTCCARLGDPGDAGVGDRVALGHRSTTATGTMVGVRTEDALLRVYGRDVWGWPVGVAVHSFDGAGRRAPPGVRRWRPDASVRDPDLRSHVPPPSCRRRSSRRTARVDREMAQLGGKITGRAWRWRRPTTATSIRGDLLTDGPFIETKEGLAGI